MDFPHQLVRREHRQPEDVDLSPSSAQYYLLCASFNLSESQLFHV